MNEEHNNKKQQVKELHCALKMNVIIQKQLKRRESLK
jgi:hypothetical protein